MMTKEQRERLDAMCDPAQNMWDVSPNDAPVIAAALATIDAQREELERWRSGKTYMGGTGVQPGDFYSAHLQRLAALLGVDQTKGWDPVDTVRKRLDAQREEIEAHVAQCNMVGAQRDALEAEKSVLKDLLSQCVFHVEQSEQDNRKRIPLLNRMLDALRKEGK